MSEPYDVVIAGASFAGLAAASRLRGARVLLVDRKPVGAQPVSACGTFVDAIRPWDGGASIQQVHRRLVFHVAGRALEFPSARPFCTFDYTELCRSLFERSGAQLVRARVTGLRDDLVETDQGSFRGRALIDATGWRAVLARAAGIEYPTSRGLSFGLERPVPRQQPEGLHFWIDRRLIPSGLGWIFPAGEVDRAGVGSYVGGADLARRLDRFCDQLGLPSTTAPHGSYFTNELRRPTFGRVFAAGDAAGQCLALTGEGIRQALYFGAHCGDCVGRVLTGDLSLRAAQAAYRDFVARRRPAYAAFKLWQSLLSRLPDGVYAGFALALSLPFLRSYLLDRYHALAADPT
ncbi:MAG: NAD(P)/FAD-dependent oxidoreductase [Chloroflexi bacterium]|nr:NAD(P)/FAD-dependent oxidoreductase [Chloroflexota bacterium]